MISSGIYLMLPLYISSVFPLSAFQQNRVIISRKEQREILNQANLNCNRSMQEDPYPTQGLFCNRTWDGILCWPDTPAGMVADLPCPQYIHSFYQIGLARKTCTEDGQWYVLDIYNHSWTNYSECIEGTQTWMKIRYVRMLQAHLSNIQIIYSIGYGISLISLSSAVTVMLYFSYFEKLLLFGRRLHCPRNTLHMNMFASFIFRAAICFIKEYILVDGLGLPLDLHMHANGSFYFREDTSHWQCKLLFSLFHYILAANYIWIFIEGLYLHNLITVALFSKKNGVRPYIIGGWGFPLTFVLPWVIVRLLLEDTLCWNTHSNKAYFWIMRGPIMATVIVNFLFFVNIIRILFTKLSMNRPQRARNFRYRRLAKSTLVLIPLFGVHYMVFLGLPDDIGEVAELVKLYFEMLLNSFQGFFVAILFCYMNAEVQSELQKVWLRRKRGRLDSATLPRTHWQSVMTSSIMRHCSSLRLMNSTSTNEKRASQTFRLQSKQQSLLSTNRDPKQTPSIPKNMLNTNGKATVTKITPTASASKLTTFPIVTTTTTVHANGAEKEHSRESPV